MGWVAQFLYFVCTGNRLAISQMNAAAQKTITAYRFRKLISLAMAEIRTVARAI